MQPQVTAELEYSTTLCVRFFESAERSLLHYQSTIGAQITLEIEIRV